MSYSQYTNFTGSVLCLDFGTDIGLMSDEAPGLLGNYQLGLTANFINTRSTPITPTLYVVVVYEGTFMVQDGNCSHMIGVLSRSDVLNSQKMPGVSYKLAESIYGGDFFSSLKKGLSKASDFLKKSKLVSNVASLIPDKRAQAIGHIAKQYGYGRSGGVLVGAGLGEEKTKSKKMTKEELKRRLSHKVPKDVESDCESLDEEECDE